MRGQLTEVEKLEMQLAHLARELQKKEHQLACLRDDLCDLIQADHETAPNARISAYDLEYAIEKSYRY